MCGCQHEGRRDAHLVRRRQQRTCLKQTINRRQSEFVIQLTAQERDLLIAHVQPPGVLDAVLESGPRNGPIVSLYLAREEASEFCWLVEQTANIAQNQTAQDRLAHLVARLEGGFAGTVDPRAHLVRPDACCLGYSAKQGQYLAFIHCYRTLHQDASSALPGRGGLPGLLPRLAADGARDAPDPGAPQVHLAGTRRASLYSPSPSARADPSARGHR